jgi:hypothetical protein
MNKEIFLHVGMHKTGSTFLQQDIFPRLNNIYITGTKTRSIRYDYLYEKDPFRKLALKFSLCNHLFLKLENERQVIDNFIGELIVNKILFTSESFVGTMFENYRDHLLFTSTIKKIFPEAKIIIIFRRQDDWLESVYKQTLHSGLSASINQFLNYRNGIFEQSSHGSYFGVNIDIHYYDWTHFIKNYIANFGEKNVLALPYEMLKYSQKEFLDRLYDFMKVEPYYPERVSYSNRGYSLISSYIAFFMNKFLGYNGRVRLRIFLQKYLDKIFYIKHEFINAEKRRIILDFYKEPNRDLSELLNIDLSKYGYY